MFLAEAYEPAATSVTLVVAVSSLVVVALGWMSRAAARSPRWPDVGPDGRDE